MSWWYYIGGIAVVWVPLLLFAVYRIFFCDDNQR